MRSVCNLMQSKSEWSFSTTDQLSAHWRLMGENLQWSVKVKKLSTTISLYFPFLGGHCRSLSFVSEAMALIIYVFLSWNLHYSVLVWYFYCGILCIVCSMVYLMSKCGRWATFSKVELITCHLQSYGFDSGLWQNTHVTCSDWYFQ